jgi:hypothetical protein
MKATLFLAFSTCALAVVLLSFVFWTDNRLKVLEANDVHSSSNIAWRLVELQERTEIIEARCASFSNALLLIAARRVRN